MLSPTEGDVLFKNERLLPRHLCSIGSLIDNPALYENLTAEENLKVRTLPLGIETKTITEVLQTVHLSDTGNKKVKHFSLGMKQRLGIAIALVNHPEFLILDEPTNGLDPLGIKEFRNLMTTLHEKGITILLSSHILKEMECLADHVAILINGELKYQGVHRPGDDLETLFMSMI
jgi:ABC-2 type transport system ATP-binding protein